MENRINIMNELREISPALAAQIDPAVPYQVPQGYFEGLAEQILARVKAETLPPVLEAAKNNPYSVPQGYFEELPSIILNRVRAESLNPQEEIEAISPLLSQLRNKQPFSIPAGYFNELPENITDGAKAIDVVNEELENLSPLMNGLKEKKAYQIPEGYFDGLAVQILEKVKSQKGAKVISIGFTRKVMRFAAAAVVVGIMIFGGWFYLNEPIVNSGNIDPIAGIKDVNDTDLQDYVEYQTSPVVEPVTISSSNDDIDENDMKEMLADISDEEIQAYVEQSGDNNN